MRQVDAADPGGAGGAFERTAAAVVTGRGTDADYRVEIRAGRHRLAADEPETAGGADTAPTPIGLLLAAVGSCTAITLRMYARRKGWPLEDVRVHVAYEKGPKSGEPGERNERITRRVELTGELDDGQRARLLEIAERTPVTRAVREGTPIVAMDRRENRQK